MRSYQSKNLPILVLFSVVFGLFLAVPYSYAQIGEAAGHMTFAVQVGHNQTIKWQLLNVGGTNITVNIIPPPGLLLTSNATTSANQPQPSFTLNPMTLVIPPHQTAFVNVTAFMPLNDTPNLATWEGALSAQIATNTSNPGGAVVQSGVGKLFTVYAIPSTTTTTTSTTTIAAASQQSASAPSQPFKLNLTTGDILGIMAIVIIVLVFAVVYFALRTRAAPKRAPARGRRAAAPRRRPTSRAGRSRGGSPARRRRVRGRAPARRRRRG